MAPLWWGVCASVREKGAVIKRLARIFLSPPLSQRATQLWSDKSSPAAVPLIVISFVQKSVLISAPRREMECGWVRTHIDFSLGAHSRVAETQSWTWLTSHYCSPAASSFYSDLRPLLRFNLKLMRSEHVPWKGSRLCCLKKNPEQTSLRKICRDWILHRFLQIAKSKILASVFNWISYFVKKMWS